MILLLFIAFLRVTLRSTLERNCYVIDDGDDDVDDDGDDDDDNRWQLLQLSMLP